MTEIVEIAIYNLVFWTLYYQLCKIPERIVQYIIDGAK